jgi:dihydroorotase
VELHLDTPLDMHLHLREGEMLRLVAPFSAAQFAGGVIMPNLLQPVDSLERVRAYRTAVIQACGDQPFTPFMTLFFREFSREELATARDEIIGVKLYPAGITTQSEAGVRDFDRIGPTVALLEELDIPLLVHGESNGFVMEREREFLAVYRWLAETFPRLRIVMEHITTAEAVACLDRFDNLAATVTLHHLLLTLDDVAGGLLRPHLFCKPIAGVFSAPVALPMLVELFEDMGCLERLQPFVSDHARRYYRLDPPRRIVTLRTSPWRVPEQFETIRPFLDGKTLRWSLSPSGSA